MRNILARNGDVSPVMRALPASSPISAPASVDLPEPDSPTMATVSPGNIDRLTLFTALTSRV